jgi:hypothetical protein
LIAVGEGTTLLRSFRAVGTQNYVCTEIAPVAGDDPTYAWLFVAPVADLFNSCGTQVGIHFAVPDSAPPVPEWQYDVDGSSVTGAKLEASPVAGAIPELLLEANGHSGEGVFATVSFVQRLQTVGGVAPAAATCDADHVDDEQDVGYTAQYYFYSGP